MVESLIDPFDEPVEGGDVYAEPKIIDNGGLIDPFDEPVQEQNAPQVDNQPPQAQPMGDIVASKMKPEAVEKLKSIFQRPEGIQSGIEDTIYQTGMDMVGSAVGGVVGGVKALTPPYNDSNLKDAVGASEAIQQRFHELGKPETKSGEKGVAVLGDLIEKGVDIARIPLSALGWVVGDTMPGGTPEKGLEVASDVREKGFGKTMGDVAAEHGAPAWLSTGVEMAPELIGTYYGIKGYKGAKNQKIAERIRAIESGSKDLITKNDAGLTIPKDKKLLEYKIDTKGNIVKDKMVKSLSKQGYEMRNIPTYRSANPATKQRMLEILARKRAELVNPSIESRASDVAGNSLMQRFDYIKDLNRKAGSELDAVAQNLKGQQVDFSAPVGKFVDSLKKMGIKVSDTGDFTVDYSTSSLRRLGGAQKPLNKVIEYMKEADGSLKPDAYALHELKQYIDNIVDYGKSGNKPAVRKVSNAIKSLRHDIDAVLDSNFDDYNRVNTVYSDTKGSMTKLEDLMGKKINLADDTADTAVGTKLRGLTSNAQYRIPLINAVRDLEKTATKYGAKFDDDLAPQLILINDLEKIAGSSAKTSLQGQFENVMDKSKVGLAKDTIKRMKEGAIGKDTEKALDMMEEYLKADKQEPWRQ